MIAARSANQPRGLTVAAMLVCLIVLTLVSGAILKMSVAHRELARAQGHRLQAEWLAEAGADRAIARLTRDRTYTGETWTLFRADLGLSPQAPSAAPPVAPDEAAGRITIAISRAGDAPNRRRVSVQADYPVVETHRSRHSKEFMIDLEPSPRGATP